MKVALREMPIYLDKLKCIMSGSDKVIRVGKEKGGVLYIPAVIWKLP